MYHFNFADIAADIPLQLRSQPECSTWNTFNVIEAAPTISPTSRLTMHVVAPAQKSARQWRNRHSCASWRNFVTCYVAAAVPLVLVSPFGYR